LNAGGAEHKPAGVSGAASSLEPEAPEPAAPGPRPAAMITPPNCTSCGHPIGDVAPIFWHVQAEELKKELSKSKTAPGRAVENFALTTVNAELLTKLGIKHDCCRMHLISAMRLPNHT
jgi:DNA-directed RNA polymerase subunit N (RpoN/RPB10)